jgi:hypothetical protein
MDVRLHEDSEPMGCVGPSSMNIGDRIGALHGHLLNQPEHLDPFSHRNADSAFYIFFGIFQSEGY